MMILVGGTLLTKGLPKKYYTWDTIGLPYFGMPRSMSKVVTFVKGWDDQFNQMRCPITSNFGRSLLKNGLYILLGQSSHHLRKRYISWYALIM
jgi:hypothetical protein